MARPDDSPIPESPIRRKYLKCLGAGGVMMLAGCTGGGDGGDSEDGEQTTTQTDDGGDDTQTETTTAAGGLVEGGHLRVTAISPPASLNPFKGTSQGDCVFFEMMYDRLTSYNRDYEVIPNLATDWEPNENADAWTFDLNPDATFPQLGQAVLGEDVEATVEVMQSEDVVPGAAVDLGPVASENPVVVEDDHRVTINLSRSDAFFPARLGETCSYFNIAPKNVIESRFEEMDTTDFGSGPFQLTSFEADNEYVFEANPDWYLSDAEGRQLPYVDKVTVTIIPDTVAQANALTGQRVDTINNLEQSIRSRIENAGSASVHQYDTSSFLNMVLTTNLELENGDRPFADVRVRQAMKHALDREEISQATDGTMTIGHHSPVAPVYPGYAPFDEGLEFGTTAQVDEAVALLDEAGYPDGLDLPTPIYETDFQARRGTAVQLFQQQMSKAGIRFDIRHVSPDTWLSKYWNQDGVWYSSGYAARMEQTTVPRLAMHTDAKWNSGRWSNEAYDAAYDTFSSTTDDQEFLDAFHEAQRLAHLEGAWIIFGFMDQQAAANDYVTHYEPGPAVNRDFNYDAALSPEAPEGPDA